MKIKTRQVGIRAIMCRYGTLRQWSDVLGCSHEHIRAFMDSPRNYPSTTRRTKAVIGMVLGAIRKSIYVG